VLSLLYYYGLLGALLYGSGIAMLMMRMRRVAIKTGYWGSFFAFLGYIFANFTLIELDLFHHGLLMAVTVHRCFEAIANEDARILPQAPPAEATEATASPAPIPA
jgi:hypothetical protein